MALKLYPSKTIGGTQLYKQASRVRMERVGFGSLDVDDSMHLINSIKDRLGRGFVRI